MDVGHLDLPPGLSAKGNPYDNAVAEASLSYLRLILYRVKALIVLNICHLNLMIMCTGLTILEFMVCLVI